MGEYQQLNYVTPEGTQAKRPLSQRAHPPTSTPGENPPTMRQSFLMDGLPHAKTPGDLEMPNPMDIGKGQLRDCKAGVFINKLTVP
jgi:hypothetical protein